MTQYVYLVQCPTQFKIGYTSQTPKARFSKYKTHNPNAVWVTKVEVHSQKVETALRNELRRLFIPVEGTLDWFTGHLPAEVFHSIVERCDPLEDPPMEHLSPGDILLGQLREKFLDQNVPIDSLIYDSLNQGMDWLDFLNLKITYQLPYATFQLDTFVEKLILVLFLPSETTLRELVEDFLGISLEPTHTWVWDNSVLAHTLLDTPYLLKGQPSLR